MRCLAIILLLFLNSACFCQFKKHQTTVIAGMVVSPMPQTGSRDYNNHELFLINSKMSMWMAAVDFQRKMTRPAWSAEAIYLAGRLEFHKAEYKTSANFFDNNATPPFGSVFQHTSLMLPLYISVKFATTHFESTGMFNVDIGYRQRFSLTSRLTEQWVNPSFGDVIEYQGDAFSAEDRSSGYWLYGVGGQFWRISLSIHLCFPAQKQVTKRPELLTPGYYSYFYDHLIKLPLAQGNICLGFVL